MKHNMKRVLSIIALLAMTVGTWAGGNVTINVLPKLESGSAGEVTKTISEGVCTLTVKPADGYYATLENIHVELTVNCSEAQLPRRSPNVYNVEVTALTPDASPTDQTKYKFTLPDNTYDAEVTVEFQKVISIWNGDGVSFDEATNTLTLDGANIYCGSRWAFEFGPTVTAMNVVLKGTNTIRGNGFRFMESPVSLTFMTDVAAPGNLTISGEDYTFVGTTVSQGSTTVYCENGLVYDAAQKKVGISEYNVTVGGIPVTSINVSRITGENISGIVSFDVENNILTLNGATIDMSQKDGYPVESDIKDLKVLLIGKNTFKTYTGKECGFKYNTDAAAGGDAKVTLTHGETPDVNGYGALTIVGSEDIANGYTVENTFETTNTTGWVKTQDAEGTTVTYVEYYGLNIGDMQVNSSNLSLVSESGTATYEPTSQTLYLSNYTTTENITSTLNSLTVLLTGVNSVGAMTGNNAGTIAFRKNSASREDYNKLSATSLTGFTEVTVENPLQDLSDQSGVVISDLVVYDLWVKGTQVTKENMGTILDGVTFDGDHTLTLNKVKITGGETPFIVNGLSQLTINLLGENTVNCQQQLFMKKNVDGNYTPTVTFTTYLNAAGSLTMQVSDGGSWYEGNYQLEYTNKLTLTTLEGSIMIAAPSENYGIKIAGTEVTNLNASKIINDQITGGSVSFDVTTNILTLDGVKISGLIEVSRKALNICLKGESEILGFQNENSELVFVPSSEEGVDKLTMNNDIQISSSSHVIYRNLLMKTKVGDKYVITLPNNYGITVNGQLITPANRLHVLGIGNETVQFDGNNKLILNNANLTSSIEIGDMDGVRVLTIHFAGTTVMTENTGLVLKFTGTQTNKSDYKVVLDINGNTPGEFVYKYNGGLMSIPQSFFEAMSGKLDAVFDGISVMLDNQLACNLNWNARALSVSASLTPIVPTSGDNQQGATRDFATGKVSTLTLDNVVIDNVLYTLHDCHTKNTNDDGYQNGQVVMNSKVSSSDLEKAMNCRPGSEDFAKYFTGLTFQVPAGSGIITLNDLSGEEGEFMCVKIGKGDPIKIALTNTLTNYAVEYCVAEATFVYIYLPETNSSAPVLASRRIGPKSSVAGGLGGITVQTNSMQAGLSTANSYKMFEVSSLISAIDAVIDAKDGFICSDENVTSLPDDMFLSSGGSSPAPRRSAALIPGTILPDGLTFVDFSNTKITGMEVSRSSGPFKGVPENVFIYMPAGNTTKDKNVVIGGICDMMELDGSDNAQPFKAMKDFTASQATLNRSFTSGKNSTVCLPYDISEDDAKTMGTFHNVTNVTTDEVSLSAAVSGDLSANVPYVFVPKTNSSLTAKIVSVKAGGASSANNLVGVYENTKRGADNWYCYAAYAEFGASAVGEFVKMKGNAYVPPFRAYLEGPSTGGAPVLSILWEGQEETADENTTAVETVKPVADKKVAEGWWTLNGVRLNAQPKKAGLYIKDGKMVVVK